MWPRVCQWLAGKASENAHVPSLSSATGGTAARSLQEGCRKKVSDAVYRITLTGVRLLTWVNKSKTFVKAFIIMELWDRVQLQVKALSAETKK